jgi:hypothetical protein
MVFPLKLVETRYAMACNALGLIDGYAVLFCGRAKLYWADVVAMLASIPPTGAIWLA